MVERPLERFFQVLHVVVSEDPQPRPALPRRIDATGVDELVDDDDVVLLQQRADRPDGRGVSGRKRQRRLGTLERGDGFLKFVMGIQRTADQARSPGADAEVAHCPGGGFLKNWVGRKTEVVVRREIQE